MQEKIVTLNEKNLKIDEFIMEEIPLLKQMDNHRKEKLHF